MKDPYYIKIFGEYGESLNFKYFFSLPEDTKFGNLSLKLVNLGQTVHVINSKTDFVYKTFAEIRTTTHNPLELLRNSKNIPILSREIEVIIYFVRKSIDEIISLIYVLENDFPFKVRTDCIAKLLDAKRPGKELGFLKEKHLGYLERLNEASNAYKHSFLNSESYNLIGRDEPCVLVLGLKQNDLKNDMKFDSISLEYILSSFESFLKDSVDILKQYSEK